MPRVAMDFSKTVIYHFVCKDEMIKCSYVGSTTNFNKRKGQHKADCNIETASHYNLNVYQTIRANGGWANWDMKPLEEFACENKTQQVIREQFWMDRLKPDMNCRKAYQTDEGKSQRQKLYRVVNTEVIKERHKGWYKENSEAIKEKHKAYHQSNKDAILEKKSVKYTCECGSICRIGDKSQHERSIKHQAFIARVTSIVE
jgi:hypothetical protein